MAETDTVNAPDAPPHGLRCLKAEGRRSVWLVQRPGQPPTTVKTWPLTPALAIKLLLGGSQPQRQIRGIRRLSRAGIPTTPVAGDGTWRLARRGGRLVVELELAYTAGQTVYELLAERRLDGEAGRRIGARVGELAAVMADAGIFHADYKPDNLVVAPAAHAEQGQAPLVTVIDTTSIRRAWSRPAAVAEMLWKLDLVPREFDLPVPHSARRATLTGALRRLDRPTRRAVVHRLRALR